MIARLNLPPGPRIILLRFSAIGDIVQASGLARHLISLFPGARVEWVTKAAYAGLVGRVPKIARVWAYDPKTGVSGLRQLCSQIRESPIDLVCDLHAVIRSYLASAFLAAPRTIRYRKPYLSRFLLFYLHRNRFAPDFLVGRELAKVLTDPLHLPTDFGPRLIPTPDDKAQARRYRDELGVGKFIAFVVGTAWPQKCWPVESYIELGRLIRQRTEYPIVVLGGAKDAHCSSIAAGIGPGAFACEGALSLEEASALLSEATLVIGNDTGLVHAAEATGQETIVILGPTSRETGAYPWRPGSRVMERALPCRPCSQKGDRRCRQRQQDCLLGISAEHVWGHVAQRLGALAAEQGHPRIQRGLV